MLKKVYVVIYLVVVFSIYFLLTSTAKAGNIDDVLKMFEEMKPYITAHCKSTHQNIDKCLDNQFNAMVQADNLYYSKDVAKRAIMHATKFNREGKIVSIDFERFLKRGKIYDLQEKVAKMQKAL